MNENTINNEVTLPGASATVLVNRYRVIRQLGQGGMGSVWLAEDTQLDNRPVAIKMLPSVLVSNKRAYNQLKAEALVSLKLTHPNIATVRAFEENNGNPFLVVDYIDGITLDDYLAEYGGREVAPRIAPASQLASLGGYPRPQSGGGLPEPEVLRLLTPIAAALDYAHSKGVIHRDVKPGNVMIAKDGTPYILDFGIAREIQETLTRVTGKLSSGTLMYMSPEQLHGAAPTPAQDVYSFAAMAYECLTGHPPFERGQIEYQIEHDEPENLPAHIAICVGVMAGLAKRPEERPANCAAVLAPAVTGRTTGTGRTASAGRAGSMNPPHDGGRARAPRGPLRWPIGVALVIAVILASAGLFHYVSVENEKRRNLAVAQASYERVRVSLKEQLRELEGVSHEDGFGSRIEEIESQVPLESTLRDAPSFLHAVECCERLEQESRRLVSANALRIRSKSARDAARKSKLSAQSVETARDARQTWLKAEAAFAEGQRLLTEFDFEKAAQSFAQSGQLYGQAATEAETVRAERQKVKSAEEKRAREAEVQRQAAEELAKSKARETEAQRQAAMPSLTIVTEIDGQKVSGAKVRIGDREYVSPIVLDSLKLGDSVGPFTVAMTWGGRHFEGKFKEIKVSWSGSKTYKFSLKESSGRNTEDALSDTLRKLANVPVKSSTPTTAQTIPSVTQKTVLLPGGVPIEMVWCSAGVLGAIEVRGFWIAKYELTQKQWKTVVAENPSEFKSDAYPVENLSWNDCARFLSRVNAKGRYSFRLPTCNEWEYAARGGPKGEDDPAEGGLKAKCWWGGNSNDHSHSGGTKPDNKLGLFDMVGNVWEWCSDRDSAGLRAMCGGAFYTFNPKLLKANGRMFVSQDTIGRGAGFRLVSDSL